MVCTDVGGSREVLSDTQPGKPIDPMVTYGRIVPPGSPADLVRSMPLGVLPVFYECEAVFSLKSSPVLRKMLALCSYLLDVVDRRTTAYCTRMSRAWHVCLIMRFTY